MIIQDGMGAGVSNWRLARAVSWLGQLGVVAGTALDEIMSRRLQDGDAEALPLSRVVLGDLGHLHLAGVVQPGE